MARTLTDEDIKALKAAFGHPCQFHPDQVDALRSFADEIKDAKTRRAIITAGEWAGEGAAILRTWVIRAVFIGALAWAFISTWIKSGGKTP